MPDELALVRGWFLIRVPLLGATKTRLPVSCALLKLQQRALRTSVTSVLNLLCPLRARRNYRDVEVPSPREKKLKTAATESRRPNGSQL